MSKQRNILSCDERVQLILSTVEEAMTEISRIGTSRTHVPLTPAAIEKRHREAREKLRREIRRLVSGRGRDVLGLVRQYVEENEEPGYDMEHERVMVVYPSELLSVIDAGFIAEDDPVTGERCPLCERGMTEHTRIDLYGTDAFLCSGSTRDGVVVSIAHPQALARLHDAAQREAQRQFDELTKGSEARRKAEDYAAILDALAEVDAAQLEDLEWEEGSAEFAPVIRQLLQKGPVLDKERLLRVLQDAMVAIIETGDEPLEAAKEGSEMLARLLTAIFPVRVEYFSMEESERVERARKEPPPVQVKYHYYNSQTGEEVFPSQQVALSEDVMQRQAFEFPPMVEGQTHWLIGNDYGLFYKVDAEGRVTRLENEHTASFAPEDVQPGESYTAEAAAVDELVTTITAVSDESSVKITDAE